MTASPRRFTPERAVPFVVGEADARARALAWVRSRWLAPRALAARVRAGAIDGLRVPFYVVDAHAVGQWEGAGHRGIVEMDFALPICADTAADAALMEALAPWPLHGLGEAGADAAVPDAEAPTLAPDAAQTAARKRMDAELIATARRSERRGARDKLRLVGVDYPRESSIAMLLPMWRFDVTYMGRAYRIAVNGVSGKVAGRSPLSRGKLAALVAALLALWAWLEYVTRSSA